MAQATRLDPRLAGSGFSFRLSSRSTRRRRLFFRLLQLQLFTSNWRSLVQIFCVYYRVIVVSMAPVHLLEQLIASRGSHTQIEIVRQTDLISDLHIFQHVFDRKVGLKITAEHFRQFHRKSCRLAGVTAHCLEKLFQRQTQSLNKCQRFRRCLDARSGDHVGCDLDGARLANCRSDLDDFFAAGFRIGRASRSAASFPYT